MHTLSSPESVAPSPDALADRLRGREIRCETDAPFVASITLYPAGEREHLFLNVHFKNGREGRFVLKPDGRVLKGGVVVASDQELLMLQRAMNALRESLAQKDTLPATIFIPRAAFIPDERGASQGGTTGNVRSIIQHGPHPERLSHLERFSEHELARLQFSPGAGSFAGYHCIVYPSGFFFEIPEWQNAAFGFSHPTLCEELGIDPTRPLTQDEVARLRLFIEEDLLPEDITKEAFRMRGADKMKHIGAWQERFRGYIQRNLLTPMEAQAAV